LAGKEGEADSLIRLAMQPDAARHSTNKPNAISFC